MSPRDDAMLVFRFRLLSAFGLVEPLGGKVKKVERKERLVARAREDFAASLATL